MKIRIAAVALCSIAIASFAMQGCVTNDYVGERYAATDSVLVFYDGVVPAGYRVIGQDRAQATEYMTTEQIVQGMIKEAKKVGADAIAITGVETVETGSDTNTYGKDKDEKKWSSTSHTSVQKNKVVTAKFLKRE